MQQEIINKRLGEQENPFTDPNNPAGPKPPPEPNPYPVTDPIVPDPRPEPNPEPDPLPTPPVPKVPPDVIFMSVEYPVPGN